MSINCTDAEGSWCVLFSGNGGCTVTAAPVCRGDVARSETGPLLEHYPEVIDR